MIIGNSNDNGNYDNKRYFIYPDKNRVVFDIPSDDEP